MAATDERQPTPHAGTPLPLRWLLVGVGTVALGLGVLGLFLPLVPTTPLVLLAAACYVRASPRAYGWLRGHPVFGPISRSGREGRYLPPRAKAAALAVTLLSFAATIVFAVEGAVARVALIALAAAVLIWLARMPTRPAPR